MRKCFLRKVTRMPKEQYMCQLCANHGVFNQPKKGHKQKCPHRNCTCSLCALNTKRRALDQIERQLKNASNEVKIDRPTSTNAEGRFLTFTVVFKLVRNCWSYNYTLGERHKLRSFHCCALLGVTEFYA
ncbi:DM DNA binding domain protein [Oesophagostomum dentatum]|uniref:DM DNA binding domain protein n=1 Tax=Oesophagostomum dentatum TaxID=61180 RepID=A0A0B1S672_OESDE|nr:DM DNA binding domain protein [Oesophagostomum dentatum]